MFKTIKENTSAEIVEKKSKFIANIFYIESVEEAEEIIKITNKKYFDARHNCYAFSVFTKNGVIKRFSDDGEPSGTAGSPMLNILTSQNISNVLVIVTRYFGGILLGTGGLIRAYTESMQKALENANLVYKELGIIAKIKVGYSDFEKCKYYLKQSNIKIVDSEYEENINIKVELTEEKYKEIEKNITNFNFKILNLKKDEEKYIEIN